MKNNYQRSSPSGFSLYGLFSAAALLLLVSAFFTHVAEPAKEFSLPYHFIDSPFYQSIAGHTVLSSILALLFLILIGISLYYVNNSFFLVSNQSKILPSIYVILVAINPSVIYFSKYHLIALLILWALYYNVKYLVYEKENFKSLFISALLLSLATTLAPALIYLPIILFFKELFFKTRQYFKYLLTSISAFILPFIYIISIRYIVFDTGSQAYLASFFDSVIAVNSSFIPFSSSLPHSILFTSLVLLVFVSGLVSSLGNRDFDSFSVKSKAFKRGVVFSFLLIAIDLLFTKNDIFPIELTLFVPFSFIVLDFIERNKKKKGVKLYVATLILLIVAYRLSYFFPVINIR